MGESIVEVTIGRIIAPSGSVVKQDQEILELETDKVNQVLYAPQAGKLELSVQLGQTVKIGQAIGSVDTSVEAPVQKEAEAKAPPAPKSAPATAPTKETAAPARIFALETPPVPAPPAPKVATTTGRRRMSSLRRTIAQRLVEVKNTTAMLTSFNEVDMQEVIDIRAKEKEGFQARYGVKLGFMSFFVKAVVSALKAFPDIHASIEGDEIVQFPNYDIGVAVSTEKGLMVPVIRNCDTASFGEIEKQIEMYAKKARDGSLSLDDLRGGCFTITNGGVFGSLLSTPILNPPQSGILGMHSIVKRPVVIKDQVVIRPMMYLALSYDHRIVDGKEAVQFLINIKENLEAPARLLLEL
jgi:2-oxoglutarate dehydrogenase E2 component (dihydrolipoamide succinyltransferase)